MGCGLVSLRATSEISLTRPELLLLALSSWTSWILLRSHVVDPTVMLAVLLTVSSTNSCSEAGGEGAGPEDALRSSPEPVETANLRRRRRRQGGQESPWQGPHPAYSCRGPRRRRP